MLLRRWPNQRRAACAAAVFEQAYPDVGLAPHHVGPCRSGPVPSEVLEITPLRALLYHSDAYGLPEPSLPDASRIAARTAGADARRLFGPAETEPETEPDPAPAPDPRPHRDRAFAIPESMIKQCLT
ncbi:hypothetical protein ACWCPI_35465 [Streptomyces sp. NPDC001920]